MIWYDLLGISMVILGDGYGTRYIQQDLLSRYVCIGTRQVWDAAVDRPLNVE